MFARFFTFRAMAFALIFTPFALHAHINPGGAPLHFTENRGQWDKNVLFEADGTGGLTWWIERDGFTLVYAVLDSSNSPQMKRIKRMGYETDPFDDLSASSAEKYHSHSLKFKFQRTLPHSPFLKEQASPASAESVEPSDRLSWNNNYFIGNDRSKRAPNCGNYERVTLENVWDGIDVVWRGTGRHVEFDFAIRPNADISQISVACLGLTGDIETTADGRELLLPTSLGILRQALPEAYQTGSNGTLSPVEVVFSVNDEGNGFSLSLPEGHNPATPLIVDPLVYSTYLGGTRDDCIYAMVPDDSGGVIVAGATYSSDYPTIPGSWDGEYNGGDDDAFVTRLSGDTGQPIYSTFLGGDSPDQDYAYALLSDDNGGVYIGGVTASDHFPVDGNSYDSACNGDRDSFIAHLNHEGNDLLNSTYLGGSGSDAIYALASDGMGGIVVGGETDSRDLPITDGALSRLYGEGVSDAFFAQLSSGCDSLRYCTYLGGDNSDFINAITAVSPGTVIMTGATASTDFQVTPSAYDTSFNGREHDAFVLSFDFTERQLIFSTYIGGEYNDVAYTLMMDDDGVITVAGLTDSDDFPVTAGAYDETYNDGDYDAFIAKLSGNGQFLLYSSYFGGSGKDLIWALIPDGSGGTLFAGSTSSRDFPTTENAYDQSYNGGAADAAVIRFNHKGDSLLYCSYFGGNGSDELYALTTDSLGGIFVAGGTESSDLPANDNAFDDSLGGVMDGFVAKFDPEELNLAVADKDRQSAIVNRLSLCPPYPNPFNSTTIFPFTVSQEGMITLDVFDVNGRRLTRLAHGILKAGQHTVEWNAADAPTGVYLIRLSNENGANDIRKVTFLK